MPNKNIYTGGFLERCEEEGVKFELLEEMETEISSNYYQKFVVDLFKRTIGSGIHNPNFCKKRCNGVCVAKGFFVVMLGRFETGVSIINSFNFDKIGTKWDVDCHEGFSVEIGDNIFALFDKSDDSVAIKTRKPISFQVKDEARWLIYQKMKKLKIKERDIVQIKIDSITVSGKIEFETGEGLNDWKLEDFSPLKNNVDYYDCGWKTFDDDLNVSGNILCKAYAGSGKTYKIINELMPKYKNDCVVLTPSHAALTEYREHKLNCDVIQKYQYTWSVPKESNIIIDEIGMVSLRDTDIIYRCVKLNKNIFAYGDFNQLLPVGESKPLDKVI